MCIIYTYINITHIYIYNGISHSHKKEKSCHLQWCGGPREYSAKQNTPEKDKYRMISFICGIYETKQMNKEKKEKNQKTFLTIENKLALNRRKVSARMGETGHRELDYTYLDEHWVTSNI